ncbi:MAG: hypothetical protein RBR69_02800 [Candidatus Cloacimonadaceae bacterium]|nr:hypothetical protein [Candidatus Cloacimonadota bacterium]MCB5254116.1 hypothetical protein [Candidatus Cloacimonadota bacterium]MCK9177703.1 hypothetical protein [Candidatus Cloacimonadota bacterium]MCK9242830.1 hypothetical protein [Candidatus Cloacimonadota bacterium]MDY0127045.1 hypothetical protein [Candidatus Cloacimonadaceae bacterium]
MKPSRCLLFLLLLGLLLPVHGRFFISSDPSGISHAYSRNTFGTVDIWNKTPFTAYSNPAVMAFHNGFSWAKSKDTWETLDSDSKVSFNASMLSYAQNGLAIYIPAPNSKGQFGITMDLGDKEITDSSGQTAGSYKAKDKAQAYGMAINPLELYRMFKAYDNQILNSIDLALGTQLNLIEVNYPFEAGTKDIKGNSVNIGAIGSVNHTFGKILKLEGVCGYSHLNVGKSELKYPDNNAVPLDRWQSVGFAFSGTLKAEKFTKNLPFKHIIWFDDALALRYFSAQMKALDSQNPDYDSYGYEIWLFDTFFLRGSHTYYEDTNEFIHPSGLGLNYGVGIKLHYKNILAFYYNNWTSPFRGFSWVWGSEPPEKPYKSDDMGINIDFMELIKLFR